MRVDPKFVAAFWECLAQLEQLAHQRRIRAEIVDPRKATHREGGQLDSSEPDAAARRPDAGPAAKSGD